MNREIKTDLFSLLTLVVDLRNEEGSLGWFLRQRIANLIGAAPTKEEVLAFLDRDAKKKDVSTIAEFVAKYGNNKSIMDDIWYAVAHEERPIAEFLSLWVEDGQPLGTHEATRRGPVWHVTPEEYR